MSKEKLRKVAGQLLEAERLCRKAYEESDDVKSKAYEQSYSTVKKLTSQVNEIRASIPELSVKRYWWDTPFSPEKREDEGFCLDQGAYYEYDFVRAKEDESGIILYQKSQIIDYGSLSTKLTLGSNILLFINKKQLRLHLNEKMVCRYIYNTVLRRHEEHAVPDLTRSKDSSTEIWNQYQEIEKMKQAEYQEYLKEHEKEWDRREKLRHLSPYTNKERWYIGEMSTNDYLNEDLWRDLAALDEKSKMNKDLNLMRLQATKVSQEIRERQMEQRRNALRMTNSKNIIRMIPVGQIIYCGNEIIAIFLHKGKESVCEHECVPNVNLEELEGRCFNSWIISEQKPALSPVLWHLAREYNDILPKLSVLSVRPSSCPEDIWREWIAARWEYSEK